MPFRVFNPQKGTEPMSGSSQHSKNKATAIALLRGAREAGWLKARILWAPDGTMSIDASMTEDTGSDDIDLDADSLKM